MKLKSIFVLAAVTSLASAGFSQETPVPTPKIEINASNTSKAPATQQTVQISRERRAQAYAKLLEGQRYVWNLSNPRSRANASLGAKLARESFLKAVELDPQLSEGYTALAELTYKSPPNDLEEAIRLANIAIKINPDNFGGYQILGRLHTHLSLLNRGIIDKTHSEKAVNAWKQVVRLDPRNAEGFAFLSEFYDVSNMPKERIEALKNWLSSAQSIDPGFYSRIMGQQDLSPESALVKLGSALLKDGQIRESVEILSRAISNDPNDDIAIELLNRAIESADDKTAATATDALQQAIYANSDNISLIVLLAEIYANSGNVIDASKLIKSSIETIKEKNNLAAVGLQISLGDIYFNIDKYDDAVSNYRIALGLIGTEGNRLVTDMDRDYSELIFEKLISAYKIAGRNEEVVKVISEARTLFGNDDLFADQKLISFYRGNGERDEALKLIRKVRLRLPQDYTFLKLEADILTESGKVEQGVALIKALIGRKEIIDPAGSNPPVLYDDFVNYLYISNLYSQAKQGKLAIEAANSAVAVAKGSDRMQIAKLTLATAYQMAGNFQAAETNLREVLQLSPENPYALNNLGYFLLERNEKLAEALRLIEKAVDISPTNPSFLDSLGWAHFKLNKLDDAEKYLKSAVRLDSSSATILEHLGDVYEKQGKIDLAKENWRKALKISIDREEAQRIKNKLGENKQK